MDKVEDAARRLIVACGSSSDTGTDVGAGADGGPGGGSAVCGVNGSNQCRQGQSCDATLGCVDCTADSQCPATAPRCRKVWPPLVLSTLHYTREAEMEAEKELGTSGLVERGGHAVRDQDQAPLLALAIDGVQDGALGAGIHNLHIGLVDGSHDIGCRREPLRRGLRCESTSGHRLGRWATHLGRSRAIVAFAGARRTQA